jgi:hypothetical protein
MNCSTDFIRFFQSRTIHWAGHATYMEKKRKAYIILVEKLNLWENILE